jgi:hypothetical protein
MHKKIQNYVVNADTEGSEILQKLKVPLKESHECGKVYKNSNITISDLQVPKNKA